MMRLATCNLALAIYAMASTAALAAPLDSSLFNHQYNGEVYPVPTYTEGAGDVGPPVVWNPASDGDILTYQNTIANNGGYWISNASIWAGGTNPVSDANGWTIEFRLRINDDAADDPEFGAFQVYAGDNASAARAQILVGKDFTSRNYPMTVLSSESNVGDYHIFRMAQKPNSNETSIWRDNQLLSTFTPVSGAAGLFLIWGDGSSSVGGPTVDLDYFRWDSTGYYEPVPEPASIALLSLGALGIVRMRRRSRGR